MSKRTVLVQFGNQLDAGGKEYAYFTTLTLAVGDVVVAETPRGLSIVHVSKTIDISKREASKAEKWIVSLVDLNKHKQAVEALNE